MLMKLNRIKYRYILKKETKENFSFKTIGSGVMDCMDQIVLVSNPKLEKICDKRERERNLCHSLKTLEA